MISGVVRAVSVYFYISITYIIYAPGSVSLLVFME